MDATQLLSNIHHYFTYAEYSEMVQDFAEKGMTTGVDQEEKQINATKLNAQRMRRLDKTAEIPEEIKQKLASLEQHWIWIVLAESWCGDGAQNLPYIAKLAECSPMIQLRLILRDEHAEVMNEYLTKGTRSVPKLICICAETKTILGTWGPRATTMQERVLQFKKENPDVPHEKFLEKLHGWYAQDKGGALFKDFDPLLTAWLEHQALRRSA